MKRKIIAALILLLLLFVAWRWFVSCEGVTHRDLKMFVVREGAETRAHIDERCDVLEKKLDRVEAKLDCLLEMASPKWSDGMKSAQ